MVLYSSKIEDVSRGIRHRSEFSNRVIQILEGTKVLVVPFLPSIKRDGQLHTSLKVQMNKQANNIF